MLYGWGPEPVLSGLLLLLAGIHGVRLASRGEWACSRRRRLGT
jgi:hypothetical protein